MIRTFTSVLFTLFLFQIGSTCYAQAGMPYDFIPGEKIIFEDNFQTDRVDAFPTRWAVSTCSDPQHASAKKSWAIKVDDGIQVLRSSTTFLHISPVIKPSLFPKDSFTIEFDCAFEDAAACAELYFATSGQVAPCKEVSFHILSWGKINVIYPNNDVRYSASYPGDFDNAAWHHFSLSYCNKEVKCYLDGRTVLKIPDCDFTPEMLSLGCIAPVKYGHFNIAHITASSINDLLSGKKFVTHAIHFDPGRSVIKSESLGIIGELFNFMEKNPDINLRIDGHTDGDGNAASNMLLSEARAEDVKRRLIERGINEKRLTTKGFGSTKPIKPNSNPENKAQNRRVEFMKL